MNITATADKTSNDKVSVTLTVAAADVDAAIDSAYKEIAKKYAFQGFRRGRAPRPVINGIVGKDAVLAQATEELLEQAQPFMLDELDIVAIDKPKFAEDGNPVEEHKDYTVSAEISIPPVCELDTYDAPSITMPPETATDAEIEQQIEQFITYSTRLVDVDDPKAVVDEKSGVVCNVEDVENATPYVGTDRHFNLGIGYLPQGLVQGFVGMKVGDTKEISWTMGEGDDAITVKLNATLNKIQKEVVPELNDEFAKNSMGYDTVAELKAALKDEIEKDKQTSLPSLKEDRLVIEVGKHLTIDKVPEVYENQVFQEIGNEFLNQLQRQGTSLDQFLASRGLQFDQFLSDLHSQANDRARQSLALNAIARHFNLEATQDDVIEEFKNAGKDDVEAAISEFKAAGQLPAIRESIRRAKAVKWLVDNAKVEIVDEIAEARAAAAKESKKSEKKATKKSTKKDETKSTRSTKSTTKKAAAKKTKSASEKKSEANKDEK